MVLTCCFGLVLQNEKKKEEKERISGTSKRSGMASPQKKREERQRECIPSSPKKTHAHAL